MKLTTNQRTWTVMIAFVLVTAASTFAGQTIYVDADAPGSNDGSSWTDAYNYLQDALAAALGGDEIWVAQGVYKPDQGAAVTPGDRDATFQLINAVNLKGGFAGFGQQNPDARDSEEYKTILSGDLVGNDAEINDPCDLLTESTRADNCYHVVTGNATTNTAVLDGFIITAGNANEISTDSTIRGGGLYCDDTASPTVTNCTFISNYANGYGGGMDNSGSPTLNNCKFIRNSTYGAGGGVNNTSGEPTLNNCDFSENFALYGGGMYSYLGTPKLNSCTFTKNSVMERGGGFFSTTEAGNPILTNCTFSMNSAATRGGGVYNVRSSPTLINCNIIANSSAYLGGGMYNSSGSNPTLTNCVFSGNKSTTGAGIYNRYSGPTLTNCTLIGNSAQKDAAGIYTFNGNTSLTNCILWANSDFYGTTASAQLYPLSGPVNYCCIQGLTGSLGGVGNISDDPIFTDADGPDNIFGTDDDNPRLLAGSPCIDTGTLATPAPLPSTDLDGNPRIVDTVVDMGAYEGPKQGFLLSTKSLSVPEAATAAFTVTLAMDPLDTTNVSVAVESGDSDITVESGALLTFDSTNYNQPQTVTIAAAIDSDYLFGTALIRIQATGVPTAEVNARESDSDAPTVLYVDSDASGDNDGLGWTDAFNHLQDALSAVEQCPPVEQVRVAQGIYKPDRGAGITPGDRTATFRLFNGVSVKGGYAGFGEPDPDDRDFKLYETILSGDLAGDDGMELANNTENTYHVVTGTKTNETAVLDGFIITAGNASDDYPSTEADGGGLYGFFDSSPTVTNCTFNSNSANDSGGAISTGGFLRLTNCTFAGNSAGYSGGAVVALQNGTLTNCTFNGNSANQGGGFTGSGILTNCTFIDNHVEDEGGGMMNFYMHDTVLINCIFTNNSAGTCGGGMVNIEDARATLINCIFSSNIAAFGGAICNYSFDDHGGLELINCTLSDNSASEHAGGIFNDSTTSELTSSILWANSDSSGQTLSAQIYNYRTGGTIVKYSCIQGWPGYPDYSDNIDADPCFIDPANGNYHLLAGSPCIDTGDPDYIPGPDETDLDGRPRVSGGRIDMGVYEYSPPIPAEARIIPRTVNLTSKGEWITCYIRLAEGYDVIDIAPDSVLLQSTILAKSVQIDEEKQIVIAKFNREEVQDILNVGEIELKITGRLTDGTNFEATDIIKVTDKAGK